MNFLKQVKILSRKSHEQYSENFPEEPMSFEEYVNFELLGLYNENYTILEIRFIKTKTVTITYQKKIK